MADTFPSRPVKIVVPFAPGGIGDILMRLAGAQLQERLGQPFIIETRPGAGGNLGTEMVAKSPGDGYTLLSTGTPNTINASYYDKLNFDFIHDIVPVAGVTHGPLFMVVNPSVPAQSVPEFIAYAKANPGRIAMASSGNGTAPHLSGELFKMMAGVDMLHVPYRGARAAMTAVFTGEAHVLFDPIPSSIEQIKAGRLKPLAVTSLTRADALPELPTVNDTVPGYEANGWQGIGVPKATPVEIIGKLNREINAALADPAMREKILNLGAAVYPASPEEAGKLILSDTEKWAKVVKFAGLKAE